MIGLKRFFGSDDDELPVLTDPVFPEPEKKKREFTHELPHDPTFRCVKGSTWRNTTTGAVCVSDGDAWQPE